MLWGFVSIMIPSALVSEHVWLNLHHFSLVYSLLCSYAQMLNKQPVLVVHLEPLPFPLHSLFKKLLKAWYISPELSLPFTSGSTVLIFFACSFSSFIAAHSKVPFKNRLTSYQDIADPSWPFFLFISCPAVGYSSIHTHTETDMLQGCVLIVQSEVLTSDHAEKWWWETHTALLDAILSTLSVHQYMDAGPSPLLMKMPEFKWANVS